MTANAPKILIAGGGTGGHVIPAIAIGKEVTARGGSVLFVGTKDRLEATLVPQNGFDIEFVTVRPLKGGGLGTKLRGASAIPRSLYESFKIIRSFRPDIVIGVGGYVSGPAVLGAKLMGIPAALLEQNAALGLTNRILAKVVDLAFLNYAQTASHFAKKKVRLVGNPVGKAFIEASKRDKQKNNGTFDLLIMGGSQGAHSLNIMVSKALERVETQKELKIIHQTGPADLELVQNIYSEMKKDAKVVPFIDEMAEAMANADLVIGRAGATTVSELTVLGVPAIFLPYPFHKDEQQKKNALPMIEAKAASLVDEKKQDEKDLTDIIGRYLNDDAFRQEAAAASKSLGRPFALKEIVDGLFEYVEKRRAR